MDPRTITAACAIAATLSAGPARAELLPEAERLLARAGRLEAEGRHRAAADAYGRAARIDRRADAARAGRQRCVRRLVQARRWGRPEYRDQIDRLNAGGAMTVYADAIRLLAAAHVESEAAQPARLFLEGLDEFRAALRHPAFRAAALPHVSESDVAAFDDRLSRWHAHPVHTAADARRAVFKIALEAKRSLGLDRPGVVALEFIYGACHALDPYTTYLPPAMPAGLPPADAPPTVVDVDLFADAVGYVRVVVFRPTTPRELEDALAALRLRGMRALILDLRGNPGGSVRAAIRVTEMFLTDGVIVTLRGRVPKANREFLSNAGVAADPIPLVVLIDEETASAAELVAAALRDHKRAFLVGLPTYGKGSLQKDLPLPEGFLRLTLARLLTPAGAAIRHHGVEPHLIEADRRRQEELAAEEAARRADD